MPNPNIQSVSIGRRGLCRNTQRTNTIPFVAENVVCTNGDDEDSADVEIEARDKNETRLYGYVTTAGDEHLVDEGENNFSAMVVWDGVEGNGRNTADHFTITIRNPDSQGGGRASYE